MKNDVVSEEPTSSRDPSLFTVPHTHGAFECCHATNPS